MWTVENLPAVSDWTGSVGGGQLNWNQFMKGGVGMDGREQERQLDHRMSLLFGIRITGFKFQHCYLVHRLCDLSESLDPSFSFFIC